MFMQSLHETYTYGLDKPDSIWQNSPASQLSQEKLMSLNSRLAELTEKHRSLERKIEEEMTRPAADPSKLVRWKHEKLRLKDEIVKLADRQTRH